MKRLFSLFVAIIATISLFANMQGHFFMNVADENVQVTNVESKFAQWLDLPANTTFVQFRDETDNIGIRHLSYQQYVNNVEIPNGIVLVHAKNNKVFVINGDIMDATIAAQHVPQKISPLKATQKVRKNAKNADAELKIVRAVINGENVFRYAYEVMADDFTSKQYVDAETGEIIKKVPLVYDIQATAKTYYSGNKTIDVTNVNGVYCLFDSERNIITYNANGISENDLEGNPSQEFLDSIQQVMTTEMQSWSSDLYNDKNYLLWWVRSHVQTYWYLPIYMQNCIIDHSATTSFQGTYINTIKISNIYDDSWSSLLDNKPDLYVVIKDNNGYVRYDGSNNYIDDATLPATITVNTHLWGTNYTIEIWDYDPVGNDNLIEALTFSTYDVGTYNWSDNTAQGTLVVKQGVGCPTYDVHWAIEKVYDFYMSKFNRDSYDNYGSPIYNFVNAQTELFGSDNNNAFARSTLYYAIMVYGMGDGEEMNPVVELDVVGHEFSHHVTNFNGNGGLQYLGESGALNESFSDIMGASIAFDVNGSYDWLMAKNVMINATNLRSMSNPHNSKDGNGAQPKYYNEPGYWVNPNDTAADHGGVHINSGVQNYWFYLLTVGGSGINGIYDYNISGIGIDKAMQIAYRNLIYYLTPEATHEDARNGSIQAAIDLYGKDSQEHQSVVNAWYAVGVGDKYTAQVDPITIKAKMPSNWGTTISAWAWENGSEGSWITLTKEGEWYSYTSSAKPLNIVFVNGSTWNGDNNQSVDITLSESACIQLNNNSGKRTYSVIDCDKTQDPTEYYIVAKSNSGNYYFFTPNKVDGKNRLIAVDAGTSERTNIDTIHTTADYLWTFEDGKLKNHNGQYLACTDVKSAIMNSTGTVLTKTDNSDGSVTFSYWADTETRYLSLASSGNDYYVFYANTNQFTHLLMLPKGQESTTPIPIVDANPKAQKILRNGQILILRGDKIYTLHGKEVN